MKQINPLFELTTFLDTFLNFEKTPKKNMFWIETMQFLIQSLQNPQNHYNKIHVAGSKGKGSVSQFVASILEKYGQSVGVFSSPHISDIRERVSQPHMFFPDELYTKTADYFIAHIKTLMQQSLPVDRNFTWFELITAFSFLCFKNAAVDWAVIETGLGGRLDATNVIIPNMSIITSIELEHTEYLGKTISKIAAEKGGIIKNNIPLICGILSPSAQTILQSIAKEKKSPCILLQDTIKKIYISQDCATKNQHALLQFNDFFSNPLQVSLKLKGSFQAYNAALAAISVKYLFPNISDDIVINGLESAFLTGRFEILKIPYKNELIDIVLDGAHTVKSITYTLADFFAYYGKNNILLFGCAKDKNVTHIAKKIAKSKCDFTHFYLCPPPQKQTNLQEMVKAFKNACTQKNDVILDYDSNYKNMIVEALNKALTLKKAILITGSFYLISALKDFFSLQNSLNK